MKLEIYVGSNSTSARHVASCDSNDLLDALTSREVFNEIRDALTVVRVRDAEWKELASEWYDAGTAHEEGNDWPTIAERLSATARQNGRPPHRPRTIFFASCIADDGKVRCGGWVRTRAKTDAGIVAAVRSQVWWGSRPASCGYRLTAVIIDPDNTDRARTIAA